MTKNHVARKEGKGMPCKWDEFLPGSTQQQVCFNMELLAINLGKYIGCMALNLWSLPKALAAIFVLSVTLEGEDVTIGWNE